VLLLLSWLAVVCLTVLHCIVDYYIR